MRGWGEEEQVFLFLCEKTAEEYQELKAEREEAGETRARLME